MRTRFSGVASTPTEARRRSVCYCVEPLEPRVLLAGVTLITHGFGDDTAGWVSDMEGAIARRTGMDPSVYRIFVRDPGHVGGPLSVSANQISGPDPLSSGDAEIVLLLDWSDVAGYFGLSSIGDLLSPLGYRRSTVDVAAAVVPEFFQPGFLPDFPRSLAELPFHLIGHSRGGSLVCEIAKQLATRGVWVDQVTTLDPHPLSTTGDFNNSVVDGPARLYDNVLFGDNYFQTLNYPQGSFVEGAAGTSNATNGQLLNALFQSDTLVDDQLQFGVWHDLGANHKEVHDWYYGTIDANYQPTDGNDIDSRSVWYSPADQGYGFSRLAGGQGLREDHAPSCGYLGSIWANAARSDDYVRSGPQWPNVGQLGINQLGRPPMIGDTLSVTFRYQDFSSAADVLLYLDTDQNPYDNNFVSGDPAHAGATFDANDRGYAPGLASTGSTASGTTELDLYTGGNLTPGVPYYVCAKIQDGTNARYAYLPTPIKFASPPVDVTPPTAVLYDPPSDGSVDQVTLNSRGWIQISFSDIGSGVDPSSITDSAPEFSLGGAGAGVVVSTSAPIQVSGAPGVYRYAFTGSFTTGLASVSFPAGAFRDYAGNPNPAEIESFTVTANAVQLGSLSVTIVPQDAVNAGAQWKLDNGNYLASGAVLSGLAPGNHTISFKPITGWSTPPDQTVNIVAGQVATDTGNYGTVQPTSYSLQIFSNNGNVFRDVTASSYAAGTQVTLTAQANAGYHFSSWSGDATGTQNPLVLTMDSNKSVTATFATGGITPGAIQGTLTPPLAVAEGAQWRVNGGPWMNNGTTASGVYIGQNYVEFSRIQGFTTPDPQIVNVASGQTATITGQYTAFAQTGTVQVSLSPPSAVIAGAQWRIDGGAWNDNIATLANLAVGSHMVDFKPVPSWVTPPSQNVTVNGGQVTLVTAEYGLPAGVPTILSVSPATGPLRGGTQVTIRGINFVAPVSVSFGGTPATNLILNSAGQITVTAPGRSSYGTVSIDVTAPGGTASVPNAFTYAVPRGSGLELVSQLGGLFHAIAVRSGYAYVGEGASFDILNVSNPSSPTQVGRIVLPGMVDDIALDGPYAYVADDDGGLQVIDIANPVSPTVSGFYHTPGAALGIAELGGRAYVADGTGGVLVLDIANAGVPTLLGTTALPGTANKLALSVGPSGVTAYVADGNIELVDVTDGSHPFLRSTLTTAGESQQIVIGGTRGYVVGSSSGLQIYDLVSAPAPTKIGSFADGTFLNSGLAYANSRVYIVSAVGLEEIDVSNPASPVRVDLRAIGAQLIAVTLFNGLIYTDGYGVQTWDPSDPTMLQQRGSYPGQTGFVGRVGASGSSAELIGNQSIVSVDVSDPAAPLPRGQLRLSGQDVNEYVLGSRTYIAGNSLQVVDTSNVTSPALLGTYAPPMSIGFIAYNAFSIGTTVYAVGSHLSNTEQHAAFAILDASNPTTISLFAEIPLASTGSTIPGGLVVRGSFAYIADDEHGLQIVDLGDPRAPRIRGTLPAHNQDWAIALSADGRYAFVADRNGDLVQIADVSNPDFPVEVGTFETGGTPALGVEVADGLTYVAAGTAGIAVLDCSNPAQPVEVASYDTPWSAFDVAVSGDYVYVADGAGGLDILHRLDTMPPSITITNPTFSPTYTTSGATISVGGFASDNKAVSAVTWTNDRGGSGTATGTDSWLATGIALQPGDNILTVTAFDAAGNASTDTLTVTYTPVKSDQSITFPQIADHVFGDAPLALNATASSGLAVTYTVVSGPASLAGATLTLTGAGTVVVNASQAGNEYYTPAPGVQVTFTVGRAPQTVVFPRPDDTAFGAAPFTLTASASSGLPVSFAVISGPAVVTDATLTITGAGTVVVRASQAGNSNYQPATSVDETFTVGKSNQTIAFGPLGNQTVGDAPFPVTATSSSGLPVAFIVVSGPATIVGNLVTVTGPGVVVVRASQPGDSDYNEAATVDQSFTVASGLGSVTGSVFVDVNHNGVRDAGEAGLSNCAVFVDVNGNGALDAGEPSAISGADGTYAISGVPDGTYEIRQLAPTGYRRTTPLLAAAGISVGAGRVVSGPVFGDVQISTVPMDFSYLLTLAQHYGQAGTFADGDLTGDDQVNFADLLLLAQNYGHSLSTPAAGAASGDSASLLLRKIRRGR